MSRRDDDPTRDDQDVRTLVRMAGTRDPMPRDALEAIRTATRPVWEDVVTSRRRQRTATRGWIGLAAAALLLVALGFGYLQRPSGEASSPALAIGHVAVVVGTPTIRAADTDRSEIASNDAKLEAGTTLDTDRRSRLALQLANGTALRLDTDTRVRLDDPSRLVLERGAIFVDTGRENGRTLAVHTSLGTVEDIGTRFSVRVLDTTDGPPLEVLVRDGSIALRPADANADAGAVHVATAGHGLRLDRDGTIEETTVTAHDPTWHWIFGAAPVFPLEGSTLAAYLDWLGRETGWQIRFDDPTLAAHAAQLEMHGSLEGVRADVTHEVVLTGAGLTYRLGNEGILVVSR